MANKQQAAHKRAVRIQSHYELIAQCKALEARLNHARDIRGELESVIRDLLHEIHPGWTPQMIAANANTLWFRKTGMPEAQIMAIQQRMIGAVAQQAANEQEQSNDV